MRQEAAKHIVEVASELLTLARQHELKSVAACLELLLMTTPDDLKSEEKEKPRLTLVVGR